MSIHQGLSKTSTVRCCDIKRLKVHYFEYTEVNTFSEHNYDIRAPIAPVPPPLGL